jgi:hypothetical protein
MSAISAVHAELSKLRAEAKAAFDALDAKLHELLGTAEQAGDDLVAQAETQAAPVIAAAEKDAAKLAATAVADAEQVAAAELPKA